MDGPNEVSWELEAALGNAARPTRAVKAALAEVGVPDFDEPDGGQWVSRVVRCSSEFWSPSTNLNGSAQLIGPPRVYPRSGDLGGSWAPASLASGKEFVELECKYPVFLLGVDIYETNAPGCVVGVSVRDPEGQWVSVWKQPKKPVAGGGARIFHPPFDRIPSFRTNAVRLDVDTHNNAEWVQIDAVKFRGGTNDDCTGFGMNLFWHGNAPRPVALMATVPASGVFVQTSSLTRLLNRATGNGLFATWTFRKGDNITEYDGTIRHVKRCTALQESLSTQRTSHFRRIENTDWVIQGFRQPVPGRGGGSFANDPSNLDRKLINAKIVTCPTLAPKKVEGTTGKHDLVPMVVLQAVRDILPGEEIFVDYKAATRKRLRIQAPTSRDALFAPEPRKPRRMDTFRWDFDHRLVGKRVLRSEGEGDDRWETEGAVVGWVSARRNEGRELFHVKHYDGDEEDLDTDQVEEAVARYAQKHALDRPELPPTWPPSANQEWKARSEEGSEASHEGQAGDHSAHPPPPTPPTPPSPPSPPPQDPEKPNKKSAKRRRSGAASARAKKRSKASSSSVGEAGEADEANEANEESGAAAAPAFVFNHAFIGRRVVRRLPVAVGGVQYALGTVVGWVSTKRNDDQPPLWHVRHDDGDEEDLSKAQVEQALRDGAEFEALLRDSPDFSWEQWAEISEERVAKRHGRPKKSKPVQKTLPEKSQSPAKSQPPQKSEPSQKSEPPEKSEPSQKSQPSGKSRSSPPRQGHVEERAARGDSAPAASKAVGAKTRPNKPQNGASSKPPPAGRLFSPAELRALVEGVGEIGTKGPWEQVSRRFVPTKTGPQLRNRWKKLLAGVTNPASHDFEGVPELRPLVEEIGSRAAMGKR